ncbi:trichodiene oxygenase [Aspergillus udagawae]|nr:trichodiene oxygenase [Aspergillus udagawae]GFG06132.1 trichodiene oxygenase [Aspergillus udagawae]GFG24115.1 trichodiene oxygenase [Aspergillus udagawae]
MAQSNTIWPISGHRTISVDTFQTLSNRAPGLLLGALLFYLFYKYTRRIYFHPLSGIPGPRLAAATHLYEAYYNILRQGLSKRAIQLHRTYNSPVIRIGTNRVHVGDPSYYHTIYNSGTDYCKDPGVYKLLGIDGSILTITDPEEHKQYRSIVGSLFSRKTADELAPMMAALLNKSAESMAHQGRDGNPSVIQRVYRSVAADMVSYLLFNRPLGLIDSPQDADHYHSFMLSIDRFTAITWPRFYYPILNWVIDSFPTFVVERLQPGLRNLQELFKQWLDECIVAHDAGKPVESRSTYFDLMIEAKRKTGEPLRPDLLFDDILNYLVAGMEATSYVLSFGTYFLLNKPDAKAKLEAELREASPFIREEFDHRRIMALPYLTAVVKECLRLSNTVPGFLPRIVPKGGVDIGGYHIPGGTQISMIHPVVELNEEIFPNPHEFIPERWLGDNGHDLEKWGIAFSKGRRQCIGKNLAYMMLYTSLAVFFSRLEMELYETTAVDMEIIDQFAPIIQGVVKVKITKDRWRE